MTAHETLAIAWCGPFKGERHAYRCRSCGFESGRIDDFNISTCWGCLERGTWGDLCQQERHGECSSGDPDDPDFCPCECHDKTPMPAIPPAGIGTDGAPAPAPGITVPARGNHLPGIPVPGRTVHPSRFPVRDGCSPLDPASGGHAGPPLAGARDAVVSRG